ncbi:YdcH family protein [Brevundimonas sp. 2R-24]|uniref:YdcH family protein n=1 Tax=Peiella sedimenti TaxID=3061083 RepID=A0ABT8SJ64_9CAUL|nr:YdcH family protein [Caulobacteraceae bacterium XZ-24]
MTIHIQLYRARREHAKLSRQVRLEQKSPRPDFKRLSELKKQRLAVKDRISRLEAIAPPLTAAAYPGPAYA